MREHLFYFSPTGSAWSTTIICCPLSMQSHFPQAYIHHMGEQEVTGFVMVHCSSQKFSAWFYAHINELIVGLFFILLFCWNEICKYKVKVKNRKCISHPSVPNYYTIEFQITTGRHTVAGRNKRIHHSAHFLKEVFLAMEGNSCFLIKANKKRKGAD